MAAIAVFTAGPAQLYPSANPLMWPALPLLTTLGLLVAAVPALPVGVFRW